MGIANINGWETGNNQKYTVASTEAWDLLLLSASSNYDLEYSIINHYHCYHDEQGSAEWVEYILSNSLNLWLRQIKGAQHSFLGSLCSSNQAIQSLRVMKRGKPRCGKGVLPRILRMSKKGWVMTKALITIVIYYTYYFYYHNSMSMFNPALRFSFLLLRLCLPSSK